MQVVELLIAAGADTQITCIASSPVQKQVGTLFLSFRPLTKCQHLANRAHIPHRMQARLVRRSQASSCQDTMQCSSTTELKCARDLCKDNTVRYSNHKQALVVSKYVSCL